VPGNLRPDGADLALQLSAAHATVRFFGVEARYEIADGVLADVLAGWDPLGGAGEASATARYASGLDGVCAGPANERQLGVASVEDAGDGLMVIRPGNGVVDVDRERTKAIAVDLRGLPDTPGLIQLLEAAVAPALSTSVRRASRTTRQHYGLADEVYAPRGGGEYVGWNTSLVEVRPARLRGEAEAPLPLYLITGPRLAPAAAELAITLRLGGRAWIVGRSVLAAVAEARWSAVGASGLLVRVRDLLDGDGRRWPDEVPADLETDHPIEALLAAPPTGELADLRLSAGDRPALAEIVLPAEPDEEPLDIGTARAGLLIAHGALRRFFPYFEAVGDRIDERLAELLVGLEDEAGEVTRRTMRSRLRRLSESIRDGHSWVDDQAPERDAYPVGSLPISVEVLDDLPVVRTSREHRLEPGDTILSLDGQPLDEWFDDKRRITSAATPGHLDVRASAWLINAYGPMELQVRSPDGEVRNERVMPHGYEAAQQLSFAESSRESGWLDDLGAPDLFYLNMDGATTESAGDLRDDLLEAEHAAGLIVDARGTPAYSQARGQRDIDDLYDTYFMLFGGPALSPVYRTWLWIGPDELQPQRSQQTTEAPRQRGTEVDLPLALLVGPRSSAGTEDFCIRLLGAREDVIVVGRQSSGTDGNMGAVRLPSAFGFSFTNLQVRRVDDTVFHGVGHVPSIEVAPTPADLRDGVDPALQAAIDALAGDDE